MFGRNSINGSVKWLGVPDLLRNFWPPWTLNILAPYDNWGYRGSSTSPNWGSGSRRNYGGVSILWNRPARVFPVYHRRVFENTRSAARHALKTSLEITTRTACKALPISATLSVVIWLTGGMKAGMISGMIRLVNNVC